MKIIVLLAAAAVAWPVWAQAPEKVEAQKVHRASAAKRQQDARHCLQQPNNDAIIRCAEEYL